MRTYVFIKKETTITGANRAIATQTVVGTLVCNDFMALTPMQIDKVNQVGIEVIEKKSEYAHHDGDLNKFVDLLCENGKLGK